MAAGLPVCDGAAVAVMRVAVGQLVGCLRAILAKSQTPCAICSVSARSAAEQADFTQHWASFIQSMWEQMHWAEGMVPHSAGSLLEQALAQVGMPGMLASHCALAKEASAKTMRML